MAGAYTELERGVFAALETYSNVHRGSGHNSMVSTHLFEQTRKIVLEYLGLNKEKYVVVFCTPLRAAALIKQLRPENYQIVSSLDIGLSLGVRAMAVKRRALPRGIPFQTGGGTTKLISPDWIVWADAPDKFEAGTPAIVNTIAFGRGLRMVQNSHTNIFLDPTTDKMTAAEILYRDELDEFSGRELLGKLRKTHIGRDIRVPTSDGVRPYINLDNSASTPTFTPIWNTFRLTLTQPAQVQQEIIQEVKSICAGVLGAPLESYEAIFTSNTTEAINLVAESLNRESDDNHEPVVLNTFLEHSSNDLPWRMVPRHSLIRLSIDDEGFVDLDELNTLLSAYNANDHYGNKRIKLVAVSGASNVLGVCNNITEISRIVHRYGAHLLVDAAQLIAHRTVHMEASGIDYLAFSAHKVYAPFGTGVLVARKGLLNFSSDELEQIKSSGEENRGGIAALGKAFVILQRIGMEIIREEEQILTKHALHKLSQSPGVRIFGLSDPDSPRIEQKLGVIVFELMGMMSNRVAKRLAIQSGIGVRYGCHCAHILVKRLLNINPLLERFQRVIQILFPKSRFPGLVRISFGIENSAEEIDILIHSLSEVNQNAKVSSISRQNGGMNLPHADVEQQMNRFVKDSVLRVFSDPI